MECKEKTLKWRDAQFLFTTNGTKPSLSSNFITAVEDLRLTKSNAEEIALVEQSYEGLMENWDE